MIENKSIKGDSAALKYYGNAFLKTPRVIIEKMFSSEKTTRTTARVHWYLFVSCNYADGHVRINGKREYCFKGEYISTYMEIARVLEISDRTVRRCIDKLVEESLVETTRCNNFICFRVCGYDKFTAKEEPPTTVSKDEAKPNPAVKPKKEVLAERRAEEDNNISHGNKPRTDLLNYS